MSKVVKSVGGAFEKAAKSAVNIVKNVGQGDIGGAFKSGGDAFKSFAEGITGTAAIRGAGRDLKDMTGATAAQEQLQMQAELSRRESRRQALLSDALARSEGGEGARVVTGGRRKKTSGSSATGISGASGSRGTGVQG